MIGPLVLASIHTITITTEIGVAIMTLGLGNLFRRGRIALGTEEALRRELLAGAGMLRPTHDTRLRVEGKGQMPMVRVGSQAAIQLPAELRSFIAAGAETFVGPILLAELADEILSLVLREVPEIFRDRIITVSSPMLPSGLGSEDMETVEQMRRYWEPDLKKGVQRWLEELDSWHMHRGVEPAFLNAKLSTAGSALLGKLPIDQFVANHPTAPVYASTIFDVRDGVRARYPDVYEALNSANQIRGFITADNDLDAARNDFGMAQLFSSMVVGSWLTREHTGALNGLNGMFPRKEPGRTAMLRVWANTVPCDYRPAFRDLLPELYWSRQSVVEERLMLGIDQILADETLQSLPLKKTDEHSPEILEVIAPLAPDDFRRLIGSLEERVRDQLKRYNRQLIVQYCSVSQPLQPTSRSAIVSLVLLQGIDGDRAELTQLAQRTLPIHQQVVLGHNGHTDRAQDRALLETSPSEVTE